MSYADLIAAWKNAPVVQQTDETFAIHLPVEVAASLHAFAELYPGVTLESITTDLLHQAVAEVIAALPYEPGDRIIREDEFGDPVYEDAGPTPKFEALKRAHLGRLSGE